MVPAKGGPKSFSVNPLGTEGAEAKFGLSASNIGRGGGGGGAPPAEYGRSNTSQGGRHGTEISRGLGAVHTLAAHPMKGRSRRCRRGGIGQVPWTF